MWNDDDFYSDDPLTRYNAHQAAKGRAQLPDPDLARKAAKENERLCVICFQPSAYAVCARCCAA